MKTLMERVREIESEGVFLGGPTNLFETAGRNLLMILLREGLTPSSKVLDIGCGCLRGGYWLIHFLDRGCYFGIEPNTVMIEAGLRILLEPGLADNRQPRFDHNECFDLSVFEEKFDFFVARSIWTHASKQQIQTMLDGFLRTANPKGIFLTSYVRASLFKRDYTGTAWVGRSHTSEAPGVIAHRWGWIQAECAKRGLVAVEIKEKAFNIGNQTWIRIQES
jgi:SAM-dependent methyltransferase